MKLTLVAAVAENGVIGYHNTLPWRVPADLRHFKAMTLGKPVLMGRRTWDSIGRPLPGRTNLVLTRDPCWSAEGAHAATSLADALDFAQQCTADCGDELMVIGGADIYAMAEPLAERALLTEIHAQPEGDAFFPPLDTTLWERIKCERHEADDENIQAYSFCEWHRRD